MTDDLDLAVRSLGEFVNDQMRIISTKVVEEYRDPETDLAL